MRFFDFFGKTFISSNSIYCRDHKDTVRYVDIEETRSAKRKKTTGKEFSVGKEVRSTEKGVIKFIRSTLANINEFKRVLSRPCHSSGWQNHPVDYEIMLLQKIKSGRRREEEKQSRRGTRGWRKKNRVGEVRRSRKRKIRYDVSTSRNDHQIYRKKTVTREKGNRYI